MFAIVVQNARVLMERVIEKQARRSWTSFKRSFFASLRLTAGTERVENALVTVGRISL